MIADAGRMTAKQLDAWARDLDNYVISDAFSGLVARGPHARRKAETWSGRRGEWVSATAWNVMSSLALNEEDLADAWCADQIAIIAREIHDRPNRTRHSMNNALIAFGVRNPKLEKKARAAAKKIGPVAVDHGQTSCQTPDADAYMTKTLEHRKKRKRC
jgi:3-methyladenine DNA glycosylase AlkD